MTWEVWAVFVLTETALCLTPGPAVLMVLSQGLSRGTLASIWSALGILAGNGLYFILSATGVGAILLASFESFVVIKWVGAAYLVWLGLGTFFGKSSVFSVRTGDHKTTSPQAIFANGFITQTSNPNALVFFAALLPQFIDPKEGVALQVAILGVTSIVIEFVVLACYGSLAGRLARLATEPRFAKLTDRIAGSMLMTAGVGLAAVRHAR